MERVEDFGFVFVMYPGTLAMEAGTSEVEGRNYMVADPKCPKARKERTFPILKIHVNDNVG